jgi:hypothetical protein
MGRSAHLERLVGVTAKTTFEPIALLPPGPAPSQLCSSCGSANSGEAERCTRCGGGRFAPSWVRALRKVDRNFAVQVNEPHEKSQSSEPNLTFYRWWVGGRSTFKIRDQGQWERLKGIVDSDLASVLGWSSQEETLETLIGAREESNGFDRCCRSVVEQDPDLVVALAEALTSSALEVEDLGRLGECCDRLAAVAANLQTGHEALIRRSLEDLSPSKTTGPRQLSELSEELLRGERRAAQAELRRRRGVLEIFADRLADERSYKIVNYRSAIHRLLEQAIWILDERYWLSEEALALRAALDRCAADHDRPYAKKPADFACGVWRGRLVVASVQPPSRELAVADLDQLERHVGACLEVESFDAFEAILVGEAISPELEKTLALRDSSFKAKTYSQLLEQALGDYRPGPPERDTLSSNALPTTARQFVNA